MKTRRMGIESLALILLVLWSSTFGFAIFALQLNDPQQRQAPSSFQQEICPATVPGSSDPTQDEWPMFRGQLNHTGEAHTTSISGTGPLWGFPTANDPCFGSYMASPAVTGGRVYIDSCYDKFYCVNATTGGLLWSYNTGVYYIDCCPAVAGGRVYAGGSTNFYCWNATTGDLLWNYSIGGGGSPAVAGGCVYVGTNKFYCLNASTGTLLWNYPTGGSSTSSPAVAGGRIYGSSDDHKVYCLNATTGGLLWNYTTGGSVGSSPAVAGERVFVGSDDSKVYCLDAITGGLFWNYTTGRCGRSSPAVAGGRVYVSSSYRFYCLNATTGGLLWSNSIDNRGGSSPAVVDGHVYMGSWVLCAPGLHPYPRLYCWNAITGELLWYYPKGSQDSPTSCMGFTSPAVADGYIYVGENGIPYLSSGIICLPCILGNQTIPAAPQNLQATAGNGQITLTWQAPSTNGGSPITNYKIHRSISPGSEIYLTTVGNVTTYTDTNLTNGQPYYYKVSAVNGVGEGPLSEELSLPAITISAAPRNLQAAAGNGFITLTWQTPTYNGCSNITNYIIYRGNASNAEIPLITIGALLTYTDMGLTKGQRYYYRVSAINGIGEGNASMEVHAKPASAPNAPSKPFITIENGRIVLSWQAPSDNGGASIISYIIYRGTSSGNETYLISIENISCFTDSNLIYGQHYYYRVSAINEVGESSWSAEVVGMVSISTAGNQTFYWIILISLMASLIVLSGVVFYLQRKINYLEGQITKISKAPKGQTGTTLRKKESTQSFGGMPPIKQPPPSDKWTNLFSTLEKEFALALLKKIDTEEPNILKES